jgi:hypothetical protein
MSKILEFIRVPDDNPDKFLEMPKGLSGYWWETENQICIPFVENSNEGNGAFSKWLTELETKRKLIFFPTIISARLDAILRKRGYKDALVNDKEMGFVDGLAWCPLPDSAVKEVK